jgi:predicted aconitase with swiveling domain
MRTFTGRVVLGGAVSGESVVTRQGFNTLASHFKGITTGSPVCNDQNNPDLYQKVVGGKVLCLPQTLGSTTGGMILHSAAKAGIAPVAMLYADHIDTISAAGIVLADVWDNNRIVAIDQLGQDFLDHVQDGQAIEIGEDGTVTVH